MATPAIDAVRQWIVGFLKRLLIAAQVVVVFPVLIFLFLISPLWWLITGRACEPPEWACRLLDGYGDHF